MSPSIASASRCSREQEGLWLLEQAREIGSANNLPVGVRLRGRLDIVALARALDALVARHATLRTELSTAGGRLLRRERAWTEIRPPGLERVHALSAAHTERLIAERSRALIDPTRWPPFRFSIIRRSDEEHVLLLVFHHCVFDGASADPMLRDVARAYSGLLDGASPSSPYDRYDAAEQEAIVALGDRAGGYWEPRLAAIDESLRIPTIAERGTAPGAHVEFELDSALKRGLEALGREHGASLFLTLLAAIQVLQFRYAGGGEGDIATAVAMDARPRDLREAIGMFANEAPLLSAPASALPFSRFLREVRDRAAALFELRRFPFTEALERCGRASSRETGAQLGVTYMRSGHRHVSMPELEVESLGILPNGGSRRPLMLWLFDEPRRLAARLDYDPRLVSPAVGQGMAGHLPALVESILADPDCALGRLELLRPDERGRILGSWSAGDSAAVPRATVPQLVEDQVRRTPEAPAVKMGHRSLTYADLNARANRLAHHLERLGVAADVPVALCLDRCLDLVVGMLAILKAGAPYMPLDPSHPRERLRLMVHDARATVVVSRGPLRPRLPDVRGKLVLLDRDAAAIAREPANDPARVGSVANLAYVIYTSGSTGIPKGVAMPHDALVNLLEWQRRSFARPGPARTLQFASAGFDVAFQEIFSTLTSGGCVVLVADDVRRDFEALARMVDESRIERLFLPPQVLNAVAGHLACRAADGGAVEVITAGERLEITPQIRALWRRRPEWTLTNHYGPTETHVITAHRLREHDADGWPALPPIGRPIANARAYVLDREQRPVPPGVPGELYLGGRSLARGYFRDPKITSERFVRNPFGTGLLYRTGDVVRWQAEGSLEFLGRVDDQVKVRGFRVELGEIEARLVEHPVVRTAAVVADANSPIGTRLVAYVVLEDGRTAAPSELERHTRYLLPDYMVPAAFVVLPALPLTRNGKLDRRALPVPAEPAVVGAAYVPPRSRVEQLLADVWAEMLGLERVGIDDDFFALGGHSLLAGEVIARARERLNRDIPLRVLFAGPTVAELAAALEDPDLA